MWEKNTVIFLKAVQVGLNGGVIPLFADVSLVPAVTQILTVNVNGRARGGHELFQY